MSHPDQPQPELERTRQLFRFLKAFSERSVPIKRTLREQRWSLRFADLPSHPDVTLSEVVTADESTQAAEQEAPPLLKVKRPRLTSAPPPPAILGDWVARGWDDPTIQLRVVPERQLLIDGKATSVAFDADSNRVRAFGEWRAAWAAWAEVEAPARRAMDVFERLYALQAQMEREGEGVELLVGDGRLRWRTTAGELDHPVLLQRVDLLFDAHVPEFVVVDADRPPELYSALLPDEALAPAELERLRVEVDGGAYHPLARQATNGFLQRLAQLLGPRGSFSRQAHDAAASDDPLVVRDPVLFLRTRMSGFPAAFERVLEDLQRRANVPVSLARLVGVEGSPLPDDVTQLAPPSPWREPDDVLLSKPANAEQIQMAHALERHGAVLVQGPPGTGKSHTIANLVGHLMAQGKRVLITSHTTKALRVLRGHIVENLQPLCVAVLDHDLESRTQMEQAVRGILGRLTRDTPTMLSEQVRQLTQARADLNATIDTLTWHVRQAREAEHAPIVLNGEAIAPADASRWVAANAGGNDWIPGPVAAGAPLPLGVPALARLYSLSTEVSAGEEREIDASLPTLDDLPPPDFLRSLFAALAAPPEPAALTRFWRFPAQESRLPAAQALHSAVSAAAEDLAQLAPWQRAIVAAGYAAGAERKAWRDLSGQILEAHAAAEQARILLIDHEVTAEETTAEVSESVLARVTEIRAHLADGGSLGFLHLQMLRRDWRTVITQYRVNGRRPATVADFAAIEATIALAEQRQQLKRRWHRLAEPAGLPPFHDLGPHPEDLALEYMRQVEPLLSWWQAHWKTVSDALEGAGFAWAEFRSWQVAQAPPAAPFEADARLLAGSLREAIHARMRAIEGLAASRQLSATDAHLVPFTGQVPTAMRDAIARRDPDAYERGYREIVRLSQLQTRALERRSLLAHLGTMASQWAEQVRRREGVHGAALLPGDPEVAWRWRQLQQEAARRASLDEATLTKAIHERRADLRRTTAELIDARAWLAQLQRTGLAARAALQGWVDTVKKIGKGTGRRAPILQAKARTMLANASAAVPVWIMPLSRVAESIDPLKTRFDVVIIDEASQSNVLGLLAWYLGDRVAVVGDHEQVSPLDVGKNVDSVKQLIEQHLLDIPNAHLYDGTTSVYHLARQCFGGTIPLREHFRCVPEIIGFSNGLSYDFEIRPLRNPMTAARPHVVEYVIDGALRSQRQGKVNLAEARAISALLKAAVAEPEYATASFGAISLVGDEQAFLIQQEALRLVGAVELDKRKFTAGNPAQFQGDERDVVFLSMVDTAGDGQLVLRQRDDAKQRYNVAASRARNQLWLVHSLDPDTDLKPGDLRRRLIEYVRAPGAQEQALRESQARAESAFERDVLARLIAAGYAVVPQVRIGGYRVDMVVTHGLKQLVVECDGDRYHGTDAIPADMARQAVLERVGWRFVRVRGTRFYRDPDQTMQEVVAQLAAAGIEPSAGTGGSASADEGQQLRERVVQSAWRVMREQGWIEGEDAGSPEEPVGKLFSALGSSGRVGWH